MNRCIVALSMAAVFSVGLSAQGAQPERMDCGRALMIVAADPFVIYVDGVERGTAPLLLWDLDPGRSIVEARYGGRSVRLSVQVSLAVSDVARWYPRLPEATGSFVPAAEEGAAVGEDVGVVSLSMPAGAKQASLSVDGSAAQPGTPLSLPVGVHVVFASAVGKLPSFSLIAVESGARLDVPIVFVPDPLVASRRGTAARSAGLAGGLVGTLAGFLVATDAVAVPLSGGDYDGYKTIKYSAYGTLGAGLILAFVSGISLIRQ